jgi:hypothetical protein
MASRHVLLALLFTCSFSLGLSCTEATEHVVQENEGQVCFYKVNGELVTRVTYRGCLSGSCTSDRVGECSVSVDGSEVTVQSRFSFTSRLEGECTADCGTIFARCTAPLPPDGTLTVHFGEASGEVIRDADGMGLFGEPLPGPPGRTPCAMPPYLI